MAVFHNKVRMAKYDHKDFQFTLNLAAGITSADVGKAVSVDTSADNQVKLAADGEEIVGVIYTVEPRVNEGQLIGTIELKFSAKLPIKSGLSGAKVVARGKRLLGAGAGEVRAYDPATDTTAESFIATAPRVWAVSGTFAVAQKI